MLKHPQTNIFNLHLQQLNSYIGLNLLAKHLHHILHFLPICIERFDLLPHLSINPAQQFSEELTAPFANGLVVSSPKLLPPLEEGLLCLMEFIWERERLEGL
jgi:hypothetical protein